MAENKRGFIEDVVKALVSNGDGRYDWLADCVNYEKIGKSEVIGCEGRRIKYDITCDSLTSIMSIIQRMAE